MKYIESDFCKIAYVFWLMRIDDGLVIKQEGAVRNQVMRYRNGSDIIAYTRTLYTWLHCL